MAKAVAMAMATAATLAMVRLVAVMVAARLHQVHTADAQERGTGGVRKVGVREDATAAARGMVMVVVEG